MTGRRYVLAAVAGVAMLLVGMGQSPAVAQTGSTERVSVDSAEGQADVFVVPGGQTPGSFAPSISADGRIVVFESTAADLVAGDSNGVSDVFVRDRQAGTTERVSVSSAGAQANGLSGEAHVSGDGRFVAFASAATNLVAGDTNGVDDVFVRDRLAGTTERVSLDASGRQLTGASIEPGISDDGRFVVFRTVLPSAPDPVFVRDRQAGTTELASVAPAGAVLDDAFSPAISGDGRFVAFPAFTGRDVESILVLRDRASGTSEVLGVNQGPASLSSDGRVIAFTSGVGVASEVLVLDRLAGRTERIGPGFDVALSSDGRFVAFTEVADVDVIGPGPQDVIVYDRVTGTTEVASVNSAGESANNGSISADISADGRFVAFVSFASNLVPGDTNGAADIFVRDRAPVTSARDQLVALRGRITGFGLPKGIERSFTAKVDAALKALDRGGIAAACGSLKALANHARAQADKKLTQAQAAQLIADARRIADGLGCR
jgi:Tol biopolymer transport system component